MTDESQEGEERFAALPARHDHIVQFYEEDSFLCDEVARFLGEGLQAEALLLVVATGPHREALAQRLQARGAGFQAALDAGRIIFLDARETLSRFMTGGMPDWERFRETVGGVLERAFALAGRAPVQAFGEMVDLLWRDGNTAAALLLEEHWNRLGKLYDFSLLCAYELSNFRQEAQAQPFHTVCGLHSHVIPAESYSRIQGENARLREVSSLQQRAQALENEIENRKEVENALRRAVRARDDFLSVAGHELKTPLTALQLQLQAVLGMMRREADARFRDRLAKTTRHLDRLSRLIDELLDVSHLHAGQLKLNREEMDLPSLIRDALERAADATARYRCEVRLHLMEPVTGRWDRIRVEQIFTNLLSNALKYGRGSPVEISVRRAGDFAQLMVRDHGIGIPSEDQARIFNRFERAVPSENFGGLGLGLWIVKQIVSAHDGEIRVESEPGQGSAFIVELPLAECSRASQCRT